MLACNPRRPIYHAGMRAAAVRNLKRAGFDSFTACVAHVASAGWQAIAAAALVPVIVCLGCHAPPAPRGPTEVVLRIPDCDAFIDATLSLLRRYDLPPERVERPRRLIVTRRTTGAQWLEPWRVDSQGAYQVLESSLHTLGRVVTITIAPVAESPGEPASSAPLAATEPGQEGELPAAASAGSYRVGVRVDKLRYSAPERQITTASGALAIFGEKIPTTEGVRRAASLSAQWVPLGRDGLLEAFLLAKLVDVLPELRLAE